MKKHFANLPAKLPHRALDTIDPLRRYIQEISKYPFLTTKEEKELIQRFHETGDKEAVKKLVTSHLRLVVKIAREYRAAYFNLLDLIQEGNVGLLRAVKSFNPEKGARLAHYASWWIRSYILKYILDNFRLIKIGTTQAQRRIFFNLMKEKEHIEKLGFQADTKALAEAMQVKPEEVQEMQLRLEQNELRLDAHVGRDSERRHIDTISAEEPHIMEEAIDQAKFKDVLELKLKEFSSTLNKRESKIFHNRLLSEVPVTLQSIADEYGVSRERMRQIEERIKEKLKIFFEKEGLRVEDHLS